MKKILFIVTLFFVFFAEAQNKGEILFLVGTYTDSDSEGIYLYETDNQFSTFKKVTSTFVKNPSYLTVSPDEKFLFSVSENGQEDSEVYSFSLNKETREINPINYQNTFGGAPCYIIYNNDNKSVMTANYTGGNISVFPTDGQGFVQEISQNIPFEKQSHLHSLLRLSDNKRIYAADLGADKIYAFEINQERLQRIRNEDITLKKGTGPRHFTFSTDGKFLYVLGELSREVIVFENKKNKFVKLQTIATDEFTNGKGAADIHISPDGKFLYASNRLINDGIAIFSVQKSGKLKKIGYQVTKKHPRNFAITPDGKYMFVASRDENAVQIFQIKPNGLLELTNEFYVPKPVCIRFLKL